MTAMMLNYFTNIKTSSMILITGVIGDEITTFNGLSIGKYVEVNSFTRNLIKTGIWSLFDILLISVCLSISYLVAKKNNNKLSRIIFFIPIISGVVRLIAFISNLFILLSL
jgi:type II secretory pathway component PulF